MAKPNPMAIPTTSASNSGHTAERVDSSVMAENGVANDPDEGAGSEEDSRRRSADECRLTPNADS